MNIVDLHGSYDAIFSLGQNCLPSIQLEKNGLRTFSGVLDWMMSDELTDVCRLLENRFQGFMDLANLQVEDSSGVNLRVRDLAYNIISVHDFPASRNSPIHLGSYTDFKIKLNRRIERFIQLSASSSRTLYVRMNGKYEEALRLEQALAPYVAGDFSILLVNYTFIPDLFDCAWPNARICSVQMSSPDIWNNVSDPHWKQLFTGIHLR
ncbi:MAG: papain-like cysteine peptidase [Gorillibacterium sp.]|nr:papain-like cysteine peptidase [Gorillibacterium sp.]